MAMDATPAVVLEHVGFTWPDGAVALSGLTGSFRPGRTGLVGRNGSGKTTLLRLISGEHTPTSGRLTVAGDVAVLPQRLTLDVDRPVADLLGVAAQLEAVRAIAAGDVAPHRFDAVGDDWDVEARAHAALAEAGLSPDVLDRTVGALSGGEAVLAALVGIRLRRAAITVLDEPTNNLDRDARARLRELVRTWRGTLIVVSHDVELLELMDDTAELYAGALTVFGGPYSQWRAHLDAEQAAARQAESAAAAQLRREKRDRIQAQQTIATRAAMGRKAQAEKRVPKIIMGGRKNAAQVSAGRLRTEAAEKESQARAAKEVAEQRVRDDDTVRIALPDPRVAASRRLAEFRDGPRTVIVQGPERVALVGPNGAGKTTLLRRLLGLEVPAEGSDDGTTAVAHTDRIGYLPKRGDDLDDEASVLDVVRTAAPNLSPTEVRGLLARFLLRGDTVTRAVSALSGGERFRVALARILIAAPPAQLLVLDEPTNNLDLDTVAQLVQALADYRGGIIAVSHDDAFLAALGITRRIELDRGGAMLPS